MGLRIGVLGCVVVLAACGGDGGGGDDTSNEDAGNADAATPFLDGASPESSTDAAPSSGDGPSNADGFALSEGGNDARSVTDATDGATVVDAGDGGLSDGGTCGSCTTPPSTCYTSPGTCSSGSCSYAPIVCNSPPAPSCTNANTIESYTGGTCSQGQCNYTPVLETCSSGCANGQCNPTGWSLQNSSTTNDLLAVWGSSATDVWAVGGGGVAVHNDGTGWIVASPATAQYLVAISGTGPDNVYAVDLDGTVFHFGGSGWSTVPSWTGAFAGMTQPCIFVDGPNSAWLGATSSSNTMTLMRAIGTTISAPQTSSVPNYLENAFVFVNACSVFANSPTDIWLTGEKMLHSNGTSLSVPDATVGGFGVWGAGPSAVFAPWSTTVNVWGGSAWTPSNTGTQLQIGGIWGTSASRVFVAAFGNIAEIGGDVGEVRSYNGLGWKNETLPAMTKALFAVWAAPTGEVFAVGYRGTIVKGP